MNESCIHCAALISVVRVRVIMLSPVSSTLTSGVLVGTGVAVEGLSIAFTVAATSISWVPSGVADSAGPGPGAWGVLLVATGGSVTGTTAGVGEEVCCWVTGEGVGLVSSQAASSVPNSKYNTMRARVLFNYRCSVSTSWRSRQGSAHISMG